jgi:hypothetical protein
MEVEALAPTALDLTRWTQGLAWRPVEGAPEFNAVLDVRLKSNRADVDWAPGETSTDPAQVPTTASPADTSSPGEHPAIHAEPYWVPSEVSSDRARPARTEIRYVIGDAQLKPSAEVRSNPRSKARIGRIHPLSLTLGPKSKTVAPIRNAAGVSQSVTAQTKAVRATAGAVAAATSTTAEQHLAVVQCPAAAATVSPFDAQASVHADRLMQILAGILREDETDLARDRLLSTIATRFPAAFDAPLSPAANAPRALLRRGTAEQRIQRREIVVASQSNRVLRSLETIATSKRQKTTAPVPDEVVVATQAEKVLATLLDLSVARDAQAKRDARELRKQRDVRRTKVATLRAHAAAQSPRPEPTPLAAATNAATQVDIEPTLLRIADPVASAVEVLRADDASQRPPAQETNAIAPVPDEIAVLMRAEKVLASLPSVARDVQMKRDPRKQRDTRNTRVATLRAASGTRTDTACDRHARND